MNTAQRIVKNACFLIISNIFSYFLYMWAVMIMASYLSPHDYGVITLGFSFNGIVCIACELGLGVLTVREVARDNSLADKYVSNTITLKAVLSVLTVATSFLIAILIGYDVQTVTVIVILSLAYVSSSFAFIFFSIFQAYEEMEHQAIIFGLDNVFFILLVLTAIHYSWGVMAFAVSYVIRNTLIMLYIFTVYSIKHKVPKLECDFAFWKASLKESIPFGMGGVCLTIYFFITTIMISLMVGETAVGYYNIAFKIIFFFLSIYSVCMVALFPVMSVLFKNSYKSLKFAFNKCFRYTLMVVIPLSAAITILAPQIIPVCFGIQYSPSIIVLQIMIWALVFLFLNTVTINVLGSVNKQLTVVKIMSLGIGLNRITNWVLIFKFSYVGASVSTLITEAVILPLYLFAVYKLDLADKSLGKDIHKILFSTLILCLFLMYVTIGNLLVISILGLTVYTVTLYLLRTFNKEDKLILNQFLKLSKSSK
ncbi:flippase [Methanobacterium sp. BAmetb5]|uniref:flippase n=1 Tax=Methanobacterium sp. BAmetb5 TaxID=2025351 RepID=UPI000E86DA72|nr:flippase [Methanobacterium sp. BAmetb5]AXV39129.1 MAG: hypothetical protein CIT02_01760 [Methanobacterium sp. BAmetb5]